MASRKSWIAAFAGMTGLWSMFICCQLAADSTDSNFTPNIPSVPGATSAGPGGAPNLFGPQNESPPGSPGAQSGAGFSQFLQQQTATALQSFKNVTYQHLSAGETQLDFGDSSSGGSSPPTSFNLFEAQS